MIRIAKPWNEIILFGLGVAFTIFAAIALFIDLNLSATGTRATGTVIEFVARDTIDTQAGYAPVVRWTDKDGAERSFTASVSSSPNEFSLGESVDVLYDPHNPELAKIDSTRQRFLLPFLFGALGLAFSGLGAGSVLNYRKQRKRAAWLEKNGIWIDGEFQASYPDDSIDIRRHHPYRIVVTGKVGSSREPTKFESEAVWPDLSSTLAGEPVPVLVNPDDPTHYFVDLSNWLEDKDWV